MFLGAGTVHVHFSGGFLVFDKKKQNTNLKNEPRIFPESAVASASNDGETEDKVQRLSAETETFFSILQLPTSHGPLVRVFSQSLICVLCFFVILENFGWWAVRACGQADVCEDA